MFLNFIFAQQVLFGDILIPTIQQLTIALKELGLTIFEELFSVIPWVLKGFKC